MLKINENAIRKAVRETLVKEGFFDNVKQKIRDKKDFQKGWDKEHIKNPTIDNYNPEDVSSKTGAVEFPSNRDYFPSIDDKDFGQLSSDMARIRYNNYERNYNTKHVEDNKSTYYPM